MGNSHFNMKYENFIDNGRLTHLIKLIHTIFFSLNGLIILPYNTHP